MRSLLPLLLSVVLLPAQPPVLDKPPQDVDDALRARVKQFYDDHVSRKTRQAEQLVAEESKDDFYVMTKPQLDEYHIGSIDYSDHFTKAKVMIIAKLPVLFPGVGAKIMDRPFASFWKVENGTWCWYYNKGGGELPKTTGPAAPGLPSSLGESPDTIIQALQSSVKIDRTSVEIAGKAPQKLKITNTLPGPASLRIECPLKPIAQTGITATFDKPSLQGNETATLTLTANEKTSGTIPLEIIVSPTNQVLKLTVTVSR